MQPTRPRPPSTPSADPFDPPRSPLAVPEDSSILSRLFADGVSTMVAVVFMVAVGFVAFFVVLLVFVAVGTMMG